MSLNPRKKLEINKIIIEEYYYLEQLYSLCEIDLQTSYTLTTIYPTLFV